MYLFVFIERVLVSSLVILVNNMVEVGILVVLILSIRVRLLIRLLFVLKIVVWNDFVSCV